ncbi:MAG: universal stress protein [Acidimicrobiia bacterium]|nr:universal stress protein [Acidimicrobiia bacterium]
MDVLIATTGVLSPGPAVEFTRHLLGEGGRVTVTTVIEVPRGFLDTLRSEGWHPLTEEFETDDSDDAIMQRYVEERGKRLTDPICSALRSAGVESNAIFREGGDAALAISQLAEELEVDVVLLGATRQIFDQSAWESVSARVMIESGRPVLVLPPGAPDPSEQDPQDEP